MRITKNKLRRTMIGLGVVLLVIGITNVHQVAAKIKVSFYSFMAAELTSGGVGVLEAAEKKFEKLHPEVDIETVPLPWEKTMDQFILMASAGNAPDITNVESMMVGKVISTGAVQPLDEFIPDEFKNKMVKGAYESGVVKGKLYVLTWNPNSICNVYNKELLQEAGFEDPPKNMKEFNEQIAAISQIGPDIYGSSIRSEGDTDGDYFHIYLWNFGGDLIDDKGKVVINEKPAVDTVSWFKRLVDNNYNPKILNSRMRRVLFAKGKLGFTEEGPWVAGILRSLGMKDEQWGVASLPGSPVTGEMGTSIISHHGLVMSKQCKVKEWAWRYMNFLVSDPEITRDYFLNTGLLPLLTSAYEDEIYQTKFVRTFFKAMKSMKAPNEYAYPQRESILRFFLAELQDVETKGKDPQKAMDEAAKNIKLLLGY